MSYGKWGSDRSSSHRVPLVTTHCGFGGFDWHRSVDNRRLPQAGRPDMHQLLTSYSVQPPSQQSPYTIHEIHYALAYKRPWHDTCEVGNFFSYFLWRVGGG